MEAKLEEGVPSLMKKRIPALLLFLRIREDVREAKLLFGRVRLHFGRHGGMLLDSRGAVALIRTTQHAAAPRREKMEMTKVSSSSLLKWRDSRKP